MKKDLRTILKQYRLYTTKARSAMLEIFLKTDEALTYNHFLTQSSLQADRITIFRTLKLFVRKKLIHRIPAPDGINRYLLCETEDDIHSNFMCSRCKKIIPLKTIVPPKVKLPQGYKLQNMEIIIGGLCNCCQS